MSLIDIIRQGAKSMSTNIKTRLQALRNSTTVTFWLAIITFAILLWYKVYLCAKAKGPLKIFLLLNSLAVSDIKIISPRYVKTGGKLSPTISFLLRISGKFVNLIVSKTLLMREIPKARHFTYLSLLILHYLVFSMYYRALQHEAKLKQRAE